MQTDFDSDGCLQDIWALLYFMISFSFSFLFDVAKFWFYSEYIIHVLDRYSQVFAFSEKAPNCLWPDLIKNKIFFFYK